MKIKKLSEYTDDEIREILTFWFNYYGKKVYSFDELEKFRTIINSYGKTMFGAAVLLYKKGLGPTVVLDAIRGDMKVLEENINELNTISAKDLHDLSSSFIREVVSSYNAGEKSTMPKEEILSQILKMFGVDINDATIIEYSAGSPTLSDRLEEIAKYVLFKDDEIVYGMPDKNYVIEVCNKDAFVFCAERLSNRINDILSIVSEIKISNEPVSLKELCLTKDNKKWTNNTKDVEFLVSLLLACGIIKETKTKDGNTTYVKANKVKKKIVGKKPSEFPCVKGFLQKKMGKNLTISEIVDSITEVITKEAREILSLLGFEIHIEKGSLSFYNLNNKGTYKAKVELTHEKISFESEIDNKTVNYTLELKEGKNKGDLLTTETISTMSLNKEDSSYGEYTVVQLGNDINNPSKICSTSVNYYNSKSDNKVYKCAVTNDQLYVSIESDVSSFTKNINRRSVYFTDPISDKVSPCALMISEKSNNDELNISLDREEEDRFSHNIDSKSKDYSVTRDVASSDEAKTIAVNYLRTTRVKNTCNHVLDILDGVIPNIKDYIKNTHAFFEYLTELMSAEPEETYEDTINRYSIKEVNLPNEGNNGRKKKRNGK